MTGEIITRTKVVDLVAKRNRLIQLFDEFFNTVDAAHDTRKQLADPLLSEILVAGLAPSSDKGDAELKAFRQALEPPDTEYLREVVRRVVDTRMWEYVVRFTSLDVLMDNKAKEELRRQLEYRPIRPDYRHRGDEDPLPPMPPFTEDTIESTIEYFVRDAESIWRRGIAEAFSSLDSRFKTHDGFTAGRLDGKGKTGGRIILEGAFNDDGRWTYGERQRNRLLDVERVFLLLDGKKIGGAYAGIVGQIDAERKRDVEEGRASSWRPFESIHENEYFRIRIYANGNLHVWMLRRDLVQRVNEELAKYYSTSVGWGRYDDDSESADPEKYSSRALSRPLARNFGEFDSPKDVVDRLVDETQHWLLGDYLAVLEPSAGVGNIAERFSAHAVDVVEIQPERCEYLRGSGKYRRVINKDFLSLTPHPSYDLIPMNPPFDQLRDIDHVLHAYEFLKSGGRLVSVMSASARYSSKAKAQTFVRWVKSVKGRFEDLPAGSFKEAGTYVNACLVTLNKPKVR